MDVNEMIDRYVNEVGQSLPRKSRTDIELELRSLLLDSLEERGEGEPTPKIAAELLREFGSPEEIAAQYRPEEVLIGAKLFPTYKFVVTITLAIIGGLHLLGLGFVLWQSSGAEFIDEVLSFAFSFGRSAILNAGIVTLVFAVIERVSGDSIGLPQRQAKPFDPYQLPPVKDPDRVSRAELAIGVFFTLAFISWLNIFPEWFGGAELSGEGSGIFVLLSAEFIQQVPWLTTSWLIEAVLKTAVLIQGRWNRVTRWLEVGVSGFGLYVTYRIFSLETISTVPFFTTGAKAVLAIVLLVWILELVGKLFRLLFGRPFTPRTFIKSKMA